MCIVCNKNILIGSTGKIILLRHKQTQKHIMLSKSSKTQLTLTSMSTFKLKSSLEAATKRTDLHLSAFVSEHNLSYNVMEHLPNAIAKHKMQSHKMFVHCKKCHRQTK